jgi:2-C-methyl-D-erythritol 2,4-cyclodiphosphate synthase
VVAAVAASGWQTVNADCTVVAEYPQLAPYVDAMADHIGAVLGGPVSVKATRAEGLGALGRAEGIGCLASVLVARTSTHGHTTPPVAGDPQWTGA